METNVTLRFIEVLRDVCKALPDADPALAQATTDAVANPDPARFVQVQESLAQLDVGPRERLLRAVHRHMSIDVTAIWDQMPYAQSTGKTN